MKISKSTAANLFIAVTLLNPVAGFGLLSGIFDAVAGLITGIVCVNLHILADLTHFLLKRDEFSSELALRDGKASGCPKAGFVVSRVDKDKSGRYKVTCNYQADRYDDLHKYLGGKIHRLRLVNTGVVDIVLGGVGYLNVDNWFHWSTSFLVKPERIHGKCCIPRNFQIHYDFFNDGSDLCNVIGSELGYNIVYGIQGLSTDPELSQVDDPNHVLDNILGEVTKRGDDEQPFGDFSNLSNAEKRDVAYIRNLIQETRYNRPVFPQYCWECGC